MNPFPRTPIADDLRHLADPALRALTRLQRAGSLRTAGALSDATAELEAGLADASATPYDVPFETRVQLGLSLADLYMASDDAVRAQRLLMSELAYAERIDRLIQMSGSPEQRRAAHAGYLQVRDRAAQVALIGQPAPEIKDAEWVLGSPTTLAAERGRVVLLEFWATWCRPCLLSFAVLQRLHADYHERGLTILALTRHYAAGSERADGWRQETEVIRAAVDGRGLSFAVGVVQDASLQRAYGANAVPTLVLIDRAGLVRCITFSSSAPGFDQALGRWLSDLAIPAPFDAANRLPGRT